MPRPDTAPWPLMRPSLKLTLITMPDAPAKSVTITVI
jgi:hypothetical protein